jgi:type IV pilus assembly protein PilO
LVLAGIGLGILALLWFVWITPVNEELETERQQEITLRQTYTSKLAQAINLEELKKQLEQVRQYVTQLEKQLPSKAEMDALLSDINQAGLGRSLQFELFRPGQVAVKDYYAELPISLRITGGYHDVGLFASDIAHLSRIVTLNDLSLNPAKDKDGVLVMEGVAKTYRYLDPEEVAAQQKAASGKGAPK